MKNSATLGLFLFAVVLASCSSSNKLSKTLTTLSDNNWQLFSIGQSMYSPSSGGTTPMLSFDPQNQKVNGNTGCNNFSGSFTADKDKLSFGSVGATKMACPDMQKETDFLNALSKTSSFSVYEGKLILKDAAGTQLMAFDPVKKM